MATLAFSAGIVMEWTPEDSPIAVAFHPHRGSQDLFGGGQDIFHKFFYDLLLDERSAQDMDEGSHSLGKPGMEPAGGDVDQGGKECEGSPDPFPGLERLKCFYWDA